LHRPPGRLGDPGRSIVLRVDVDGAAGAVFLQTDRVMLFNASNTRKLYVKETADIVAGVY